MDVTMLVRRIEERAARPDFGPDPVRDVLAEALTGGGDWLDERYTRREPDRPWTLHPLYRAADGRCSVVVAVFRPGAAAPIHDHGAWAAIGIYRGRERETWYRLDATERLTEVRTFVNETGAVSVVPAGVIHTVAALDGPDAVSLHVYGTDIVTQERRAFDPVTHRAEPYRPAFERAAPR